MGEPTPMSVDEALRAIIAGAQPLASERVPLDAAEWRVLAADVASAIPLPPFANSAMDGYAARSDDLAAASVARPVTLPIASRVRAGDAGAAPVPPGQVARIMTGAPIPPGVDAVVKFEDTTLDAAGRVTFTAPVAPGTSIRVAGEDVARGAVALPAGTLLAPAAIGLLAALGYEDAPCVRRPRVVIIGTGDEIVPPGGPLAPGKVFDSNGPMIASLARRCGGEVVWRSAVGDDERAIAATFADALRHAPDLLVTSGGVSVGDFDLVKDALARLGHVTFWQIRMRPGKPLAYGEIAGVSLLGLPGNPVAAFVGFALFGRARLAALLGRPAALPLLLATCAAPIRNGSGRRNFLRGVVTAAGGRLVVREAHAQGPNHLSALALSNCLIVAPEDRPLTAAGDLIPIMPLDPALATLVAPPATA